MKDTLNLHHHKNSFANPLPYEVLTYSKIPDPGSIAEALTYLFKKLSPTPK